VLVDGAMFADWYLAADWQPADSGQDDDGDDGFGHHDADDALHDARREDDLR
jgi:hypothetical protein